MDGFTIGQVAKQANVNIETLRYYERRGLIPRPPDGCELPRVFFRQPSASEVYQASTGPGFFSAGDKETSGFEGNSTGEMC